MTEQRQSFDEMYLESKAKVEAEYREEQERAARAQAARDAFLKDLFGSGDRQSWLVPQPVSDFDATLAEHFAQLRNAVRYALEDAIDDHRTPERRNLAQTAMTRMIQVNLALAKALKAPPPRGFDFRMTVEHKGTAPTRAISKTVRGGAPDKDAQD